ncbi:hypothetical protein PGT21_024205 [Puccinia graminis f. sp. tritici]|uniref:Uncharacterized protein n=1 Tax=Puccinia graminis f. sp. tritici TaxID=56615 RepID=A0A5B0ME38_PUCGR|nr:hypothetical protein PGT21_024205 [Puccinia graminis f. sp. tritici]
MAFQAGGEAPSGKTCASLRPTNNWTLSLEAITSRADHSDPGVLLPPAYRIHCHLNARTYYNISTQILPAPRKE